MQGAHLVGEHAPDKGRCAPFSRKILAIHAKCLRIQDFYRECKISVWVGVAGVRHRWSKKPPPSRRDGLFCGLADRGFFEEGEGCVFDLFGGDHALEDMADLAASIEEILARYGEDRPKNRAAFGNGFIGKYDGIADIESLEKGKQDLFGLGIECDPDDTKALCAVLAREVFPTLCEVLAGHTMTCKDIEQDDLAAQCVEVDVGVL